MPSLIERKRQYTRDMIVGAAEDLFSRHGYHNTQVMDIVKAVGMSAGTFYNYFKDKRDLFAQIAHQNLYELRRRIKKLREPVNIWDHGDRVEKLNASTAPISITFRPTASSFS
jgi:AcrR family transcriptional regulator